MNKNILLILSTVLIASCGPEVWIKEAKPTCKVKDVDSGVIVSCEGSEDLLVEDGKSGKKGEIGRKGPKGETGSQGESGKDGLTSLVDANRSSVDSQICESEQGVVINLGLDVNKNLILDSQEISKTEVVCDGSSGEDGEDANSSFLITQVLDPCGNTPNKPDEIILKLQNGSFMAWYKNLGLSLLEKNVHYRTTDKQKCDFEITEDGFLNEL